MPADWISIVAAPVSGLLGVIAGSYYASKSQRDRNAHELEAAREERRSAIKADELHRLRDELLAAGDAGYQYFLSLSADNGPDKLTAMRTAQEYNIRLVLFLDPGSPARKAYDDIMDAVAVLGLRVVQHGSDSLHANEQRLAYQKANDRFYSEARILLSSMAAAVSD